MLFLPYGPQKASLMKAKYTVCQVNVKCKVNRTLDSVWLAEMKGQSLLSQAFTGVKKKKSKEHEHPNTDTLTDCYKLIQFLAMITFCLKCRNFWISMLLQMLHAFEQSISCVFLVSLRTFSPRIKIRCCSDSCCSTTYKNKLQTRVF